MSNGKPKLKYLTQFFHIKLNYQKKDEFAKYVIRLGKFFSPQTIQRKMGSTVRKVNYFRTVQKFCEL